MVASPSRNPTFSAPPSEPRRYQGPSSSRKIVVTRGRRCVAFAAPRNISLVPPEALTTMSPSRCSTIRAIVLNTQFGSSSYTGPTTSTVRWGNASRANRRNRSAGPPDSSSPAAVRIARCLRSSPHCASASRCDHNCRPVITMSASNRPRSRMVLKPKRQRPSMWTNGEIRRDVDRGRRCRPAARPRARLPALRSPGPERVIAVLAQELASTAACYRGRGPLTIYSSAYFLLVCLLRIGESSGR